MMRRFELSPTSLKPVRSLMFGGNYILIERHQSVFCFSTDFFSFTFGQFANPTKQRQGRKKRLFALKTSVLCLAFPIFSVVFFFFSATPPFSHLVQNSTVISHNRNHTECSAAFFFPLSLCVTAWNQ